MEVCILLLLKRKENGMFSELLMKWEYGVNDVFSRLDTLSPRNNWTLQVPDFNDQGLREKNKRIKSHHSI